MSPRTCSVSTGATERAGRCRWPAVPLVLLSGIAVLGAACTGDDAGDDGAVATVTGGPAATPPTSTPHDSDPTMPAWVQRVHPPPNASNSPERAVSVDATTVPAGQELRLIIDGIDVTAQALTAEPSDTAGIDGQPTNNGSLRYDPRDTAGAPLVELRPGEHSATAELRERSEFGGRSRLIDAYTWQFVLQ